MRAHLLRGDMVLSQQRFWYDLIALYAHYGLL